MGGAGLQVVLKVELEVSKAGLREVPKAGLLEVPKVGLLEVLMKERFQLRRKRQGRQ